MGAYIWQLLLLAQNPLTLSGCSTVKKNSDQNLLQFVQLKTRLHGGIPKLCPDDIKMSIGITSVFSDK